MPPLFGKKQDPGPAKESGIKALLRKDLELTRARWGKTLDVLQRVRGLDGHIFNLGHGVLPDTPPDVLQRVVDLVHSETSRGASRDETERKSQ